ncbi:substrate-binding domain-containing protein [Salipiger abyssi]|uniref:substrate-binding domain-containing protein n=1 Tax=Salipiger abyssi TaxID=1250539 RepID=UPI004059AEDB
MPVPSALSVTGCNDVSIARLCHPQRTTVHLPDREIGEAAGRILIERIKGAPHDEMTRLPYRLMLRETLGPPGGSA